MQTIPFIPQPLFDQHDAVGTLGDSESITESDMEKIDNQLSPFNLEILRFSNGAAVNWIIIPKGSKVLPSGRLILPDGFPG